MSASLLGTLPPPSPTSLRRWSVPPTSLDLLRLPGTRPRKSLPRPDSGNRSLPEVSALSCVNVTKSAVSHSKQRRRTLRRVEGRKRQTGRQADRCTRSLGPPRTGSDGPVHVGAGHSLSEPELQGSSRPAAPPRRATEPDRRRPRGRLDPNPVQTSSPASTGTVPGEDRRHRRSPPRVPRLRD